MFCVHTGVANLSGLPSKLSIYNQRTAVWPASWLTALWPLNQSNYSLFLLPVPSTVHHHIIHSLSITVTRRRSSRVGTQLQLLVLCSCNLLRNYRNSLEINVFRPFFSSTTLVTEDDDSYVIATRWAQKLETRPPASPPLYCTSA